MGSTNCAVGLSGHNVSRLRCTHVGPNRYIEEHWTRRYPHQPLYDTPVWIDNSNCTW